jgi:hypothetical protein
MNLVLVVIAVVAFGAYSALVWTKGGENAVASYKEKLEQADKQLQEAARDAITEAQNKITDMTAAYEAGEANAKTVEKKIYLRATSDLTKFPVFANPACVLPPQSLALLTAALKGARSGVVIPAEGGGPNPPEIVAPAPSSQAVPATGPPPKPVPRKKAP